MTDKKVQIKIPEWRIDELPMSCTMIMIAPPGSGKSMLLENLAYYNRHKYPVARLFMGTGSESKENRRFKEIFGDLFITNGYDELEMKRVIQRQRQCLDENTPNPYCITYVDDCMDDPKLLKTKTFQGLFKLGSQHWAQLFAACSQYAMDLLPGVRKCASYIVLGYEKDEVERKKLYENYGGTCGTYQDFCELMDQITGDYTFLVIKKRSQTAGRESNIFFYRTRPLGKWRFGCEEYIDWHEKRYNKQYKEKFDL